MNLNKNVWYLMLAGAFGLCIAPMVVFIGGLIGTELAPQEELATLPVAAIVIGTALSVFPVSQLMARFGRRPVFVGSSILSVIVALLAGLAVSLKSFWGFTFATVCLGGNLAVIQQYRFAAMESVEPQKVAQAASFVLLGGLVAAVLGPEMASIGKDLFEQDYVGSFVLLSLMSGLGGVFVLLYRAEVNSPIASAHNSPQPVDRGLYTNRLFWVAVFSSTIGYAVMSYIMTATPVSMHLHDGHSLVNTKWVIQSHILAMFLPSFFSGMLANRLGLKRLMSIGLVFYAVCIGMTMSGVSLMHYWGGLVLLGLGWNFLFVSGTLLLAKTYRPSQRFKAQGFHDFFVFGSQAFASLGSGVIIHRYGWDVLVVLAIPLVVFQCVVMWFGFRRASEA